MRAALGLVALLVPGLVAAAVGPGDHPRTGDVAGTPRDWVLHVPPGYDGTRDLPLVLDLHGWTSTGAEQRIVSGIQAVADREGVLVVWPNGVDNAWNAGICCAGASRDDVAFLREVVARTAAEVRVDPERIYATGLSNGGAMSHRLACDAADLFAAVAPMAFPLPYADFADCRPARAIPVLTVMGLTDTLVAYEGGPFPSAADTFAWWRDANGCTGTPATVAHGVARCETYASCNAGVEVSLCSVVAQAFPGLPISGHVLYLNDQLVLAEEAWRFLSRFTLSEVAPAAETALSGTARLRFGTRKGARERITWTAAVSAGTWNATTADGAKLGGSARRRKRARAVTLTPTAPSLERLTAEVLAHVEALTGTSGWQITLDPNAVLHVQLDRNGVPRALRATLRIRRSDVAGAAVGRLTLALKRR
ncbi:MAG: hypothetical protein KIT14_21150 [bacterium]|nr:hypothetical protein [bacterium]